MVSMLGRDVYLLSCVNLLLTSMSNLSGRLGSCRMHNIALLHLDVLLGNRAVGGYDLLFVLLL